MPDLSTSIREYYDAAAEPVDVPEILERSGHRRVVPNWAVAVAAALAVFVLIGGFVWLISGTDSEVIEEPMPTVTTSVPTTVPDETPVSVPDATPPPVSVPDTAPRITIDAALVASSLPGDVTESVAVANGSLWAWTGLGIIRWDLEQHSAELFTSADGLPFANELPGRLVVAPGGTVWAYDWNQDLARFDGTRWSEPAGYDQLDIVNPRCVDGEECPNPLMAMAAGPDGGLSLAFGEETLVQFDGAEWTVLPVSDLETHGGSAWATDMTVASDGTLWIASWEELLAYDGAEWARFTAADGLPSGWISSVAAAPNGDIWIGTTGNVEGDTIAGVARFDGDSWTVFDETNGLHNATTGLTIGPDGTVWATHHTEEGAGADLDRPAGSLSRFDGTTWSSVTLADTDLVPKWGGAVVDDTGTLWIASRWGVIGFDGTETTVLRFPEGTRQAATAAPVGLPSEIFPADEGPIEWRWGPLGRGTIVEPGVEELVLGEGCYGSIGDSRQAVVDGFNGGKIDFELGYGSAPDVVVTDEGGTVTNVGNPFGEQAWLCSVAATDTHLLAVGSGVWRSADGIAWNTVEVFEEFAGWKADGGVELMWAAAGPGGYMVLGQDTVVPEGAVMGLGWYSEDLQTWYEITLEGGQGTSTWGWIGPSHAGVGEEIVIVLEPLEGWIGTRSP